MAASVAEAAVLSSSAGPKMAGSLADDHALAEQFGRHGTTKLIDVHFIERDKLRRRGS